MSTLRISNIEAKADSSSPTVDEQLKFTNSDGDLMLYLDGRTAGITTVGINTTNQTIKFDANNNVMVTGIITATEFHGALAVGTSVTYGDNEKAYFGTGLDMSIYHNGSNTIIKNDTGELELRSNVLKILGSTGAEASVFNRTGSVDLMHNGTKKFETTNTGVTVTGNVTAHDFLPDSNAFRNIGTSSNKFNQVHANTFFGDGDFVELDVDGHTNLDNVSIVGVTTMSGSGNTPQNNSWATNSRLNLHGSYGGGIAFNDSGNNGFVQYVDGSGVNFHLKNGAVGGTTKSSIRCIKDSNVELYYNGNKKFETTNTGAVVSGIVTATSFSGNHIGISTFNAGNVNGIAFPLNVKQDNNDADYDMGTGIKLHGGSSTEFYKWSAIVARGDNNGQGGYSNTQALAFYTYHGGLNAIGGTEKMRLTSGGNLGIGVDNPGYKTQISVVDTTAYSASTISANQFQLAITNTGAAGVAGILFVTEPSSGNGGHCGIRALSTGSGNSDLTFSTRGSNTQRENLRIANNGTVLFGTTTTANSIRAIFQGYPDGGENYQARIRFQSNQATNLTSGSHIANLLFTNASGSEGSRIDVKADANWGTGSYPSRIEFSTTASSANTPTEKLRIASTGMITLGNPTNTTLKAEINNSVNGHYFVSQCDDNQNGFEIYQQHGATHTRAAFAVYDNKTGSKDLSFKIDGAGWTYHNTTNYGTTNGAVDKRYNWGSTNNLNFGMHCTTRQRYSIWEHRQVGRTNERTAQMSCGENGSNQGIVYMYSSTANADVTGGVNLVNGATSWSGNSDMRLKNKTGDILNALEDINKIEPLRFTWKYGPDNNPHVGVSAQSVENVVPEAIDRGVDVERQREGDETEYMKVRYTELIPLSIAAIKELKAEVESLKAEIASLKSS